MKIRNSAIDNGQAFDWGRASREYAKYRDIYPPEFYGKLAESSLGIAQRRQFETGSNWRR